MSAAETIHKALDAYGQSTVLSDGTLQLNAFQVTQRMALMAAKLTHCKVLAVLADNSTDWVLADLTTLRMGVVHLPIPTFFSTSQIKHALTISAADAVLTDQVNTIQDLSLGFHVVDTLGALTLLQRNITPIDLPKGTAKISFTSGSTGQPKGVCLSTKGLMATAQSIATVLADLKLTQHLSVLPLSLLLENTAGIYAALLSGAPIALPSLNQLGWQGMAGFNPAVLQQTTLDTHAQSLILVPELLKAWTIYLNATQQRAPKSLKFVAVGGAHVDARLINTARQVGIPVYEGYGLTECGSVVSLNRPGDDGTGVGRTLPHVQLTLPNGELHLQTPALLGYCADNDTPDNTAFATGDLGHLDERGHLHLMGRRKNLLITSFGRNVSPEWIESLLLAHSTIAQAVVMGDARPWLMAVIVPMPGASPEQVSASLAQVNAELPDYAQLKNWLCSTPFSLGNGLATGNGRPVRNAIAQHFSQTIDSLYLQYKSS